MQREKRLHSEVGGRGRDGGLGGTEESKQAGYYCARRPAIAQSKRPVDCGVGVR